MDFLTSLFSNFFVSLAGKLMLVALMIPLIGMAIGFAEMKLSAKMQARVGPYFAGWTMGLGSTHRRRRQVLPEGGPDSARPPIDRCSRSHRCWCW